MLVAKRGRHQAPRAPRRPGAVAVPVVLLAVGAGSVAGLAAPGLPGVAGLHEAAAETLPSLLLAATSVPGQAADDDPAPVTGSSRRTPAGLAALDLTGATALAGEDLTPPGSRLALLDRPSRAGSTATSTVVTAVPAGAPGLRRAVRASALRAQKATLAHAAAVKAASVRAARLRAAERRLVRPADGPVTSPFGTRWGRLHAGIDFGAPFGSPVRAVEAGTVVEAGFDSGGYGNFVHVRHTDGTVTSYNHMSKILRRDGTVAAGDVVGLIGSTGHSTGPHLHFEVRVDDVPVDPRPWLAAHGLVV